ncbi:MAG: type II toxin-antitoxin system RelE/ParE family toxin [Ktedonobacteraceae bacterium]|nr:type II toxin-antitoxin system RelE/ParE family toxin [Ktedonobacteraceae bacterium]
MGSYRLNSKAEEDLLELWRYRAENSPTSATKFIRTLHQHFLLLAENAQLGQARPDIAPELRYFPVKRYLILYRQIPDDVEIMRVIHGSRDLGTLFDTGDA